MPANIGSILSSEKWKKVRLYGTIALSVFDFVSDVNTNIIYWRSKDESSAGLEIAIFATISLVLGFLILSLLVFVAYAFGDKLENGELQIVRLLEAVVESIPQLWISLYVLSVSENQEYRERIYLYASATISFLTVVSILFGVDKELYEESIVPKPFALKTLRLSWESTLFFGRMTALAYMSVELGWWTALFIGVHLFVFFIFGYITNAFDGEIRESIPVAILYAVTFFFCIFEIATPNHTAIFFILYITENVLAVLLTFLLCANEPFYLFSNFLVVNMSFHIVSVVSFAIYYVIMKRNPDYWRSQDENSGGAVGITDIAATTT